jgi:hypothetical protein
LCSDTQITYPANHKYYESKIYNYSDSGKETGIAVTYAGNPNLMKMFDGKFSAALKLVAKPYTTEKVQEVIETVLSMMDLVDSDPDGLHMLCGIAIKGVSPVLLKTERKIVGRVVENFDYVGVGDSSLLRYLAPLVTRTVRFYSQQALHIGTYLILQAKRFVDGCGGDTIGIVLKPYGGRTELLQSHYMEERLLALEFSLGSVASALFFGRLTDDQFGQFCDQLIRELKEYRKQFCGSDDSEAQKSPG